MERDSFRRGLRGLGALLLAAASIAAASACVPATAGSVCDYRVAAFGVEGDVLLECQVGQVPPGRWAPTEFNEQELTVGRWRELLQLVEGDPGEFNRVAVIGDDVLSGIHFVDPRAGDVDAYEVRVTLRWPNRPDGRTCQRVGAPVTDAEIDPATGAISVRVSWVERVGVNTGAFCEEPALHGVRVLDADGLDVSLSVLIA